MLNAVQIQQLAHWLHVRRVPVLPRLLKLLIFLLYNSVLDPSTVIGSGSRLAYGGIGVVVHARARIGRNVTISQGVTIGGRNRSMDVPVIEDDVFLAPGSKILGPITVGTGSVVGANAVVVHDVPPRSIVAGVPARVLRTNIDRKDFI
jgi:serine O-acetyltransferase